MKSFLKSVFSSCLGTILAFGAIFLILIAVGSVASRSEGKSISNGILMLDFEGVIPEKTDNVELSPSFTFEKMKHHGLRDILRLIENASTDNNIKGISLQLAYSDAGLTQFQNIEEALLKFKESGKFIYAYADDYSQMGYYLSSVADSIFINPNGTVDLKGFGVLNPFVREALDHIGVEFNIFYAGEFKSATEIFRRDDMSDESKYQTREYLTDAVQSFKSRLAKNRSLTEIRIDSIMENYEGRNADRALAAGLVDRIAYMDEYKSSLSEKVGKKADELNFVSLTDYATHANLGEKGSFKNKIALVYAEGNVVYDSENKGSISDITYLKAFEKIRNDKNIKAVVFRINSTGGSAITADVIHREIKLLRQAGIPVIASFGDYAASAGYYIAAACDSILAEPNTLTGSIGVFSIIPNASELFNEKLKIHFDSVKTHSYAIGLTNVLDLSEKQKMVVQEATEKFYDQFLSVVASGRDMSKEEVDQIARGRVWSGVDASKNGLVDRIAGLDEAIESAAKTAGLDDYRIVEYPRFEKTFLDAIIEVMGQATGGLVLRQGLEMLGLQNEANQISSIAKIVGSGQPQALLPLTVVIQ